MGIAVKPYTFSAGAVIIAAEHNSNFDTVYTLCNGNLDTANLKSNAGIVDTQLSQITSASKVSGTALTGLATVPSAAGLLPNVNTVGGTIQVIIDGGGSEIPDAGQVWVMIPCNMTITGAYAFADVSGDIAIDIWADTIANYPPNVGDTIVASAPITISSNTYSSDVTLTGWDKVLAANDVVVFNVNSCTTITKCTIVLTFDRS
jgi:hypothetical protein